MATETRKEEMYNLLFTSVFGCSPEKMEDYFREGNDEEAGLVCIKRAYRDFNRTLRINKDVSEKTKDNFLKAIEKKLYAECKKLMTVDSKKKFDEQHKITCTDLITACNADDTVFIKQKNGVIMSYGQAQKWVNMSMKYMFLTGMWKDIANPGLEKYMHIPVDSIILKASTNANNNGLKAAISVYDKHPYGKTEGIPRPYKEGRSQSWSRWDIEDYENFTMQLEKVLPDNMTPLEWENDAWVKGT